MTGARHHVELDAVADRVVLVVGERELGLLPDYLPTIPADVLRTRAAADAVAALVPGVQAVDNLLESTG
jgi:hypothetical protein